MTKEEKILHENFEDEYFVVLTPIPDDSFAPYLIRERNNY